MLRVRVLAALCAAGLAACGASVQTTPPQAAWPAVETPSNASYLYVANNGNRLSAQVDVLRDDDLSKGIVGKYKSGWMQFPDGLFLDAAGTLYVANANFSGHDKVYAYVRDLHKPIRIYSGISCATDVVVGLDRTVYVADPCGVNHHGVVHIYAPGHIRPTHDLHPGCSPSSLTLDDQNDLYVSCLLPRSYFSQVRRFAPHSDKGVNLLPRHEVFLGGCIALDRHGDLLVEDGGRSGIDVFTSENEPPARTITTGQSYPGHFAFDAREDRLYVSSEFLPDVRSLSRSGVRRPNTVVVLTYPTGERVRTLRYLVRQWLPAGVAVYPPPPFGVHF